MEMEMETAVIMAAVVIATTVGKMGTCIQIAAFPLQA
jgi:hypothetical protein